jgi:dihydrofolate reductase
VRRIIVNIAASADGYIARADGAIDWLDRPETAGDYGMAAFMETVDTILWGRKTYDMALGMGGLDPFGAQTKHYVFTRRPPEQPAKGVEFVTGDVPGFIQRLRSQPGSNIWVMGGAGLIASLLDAGAIDEFDIHVIPALIGEGIPLMEPRRRTVALDLISAEPFADGVVRLHYRVRKADPTGS